MADAKPVENKVEAAAKVADTAVALTSPAAAPVVAAKAGWWALRGPKRLAFIVAGAAAGIAGGVYEFKHFTADPGKATAQSNPPAVAQTRPDEPAKPAVPTLDLDLPPINVPTRDLNETKPAPLPTLDLALPPINVPTPDSKVTKPAPMPTLDLNLPPIEAPTPDKTDTAPPVISAPPKPGADDKKSTINPDDFKAPGSLPAEVKDRKERPDSAPVIRIGGTDPVPPKKDDPPSIPKIDVDLTPPMPPKKDDPPLVSPPSIGPSPKMSDPPVIDPPVIKSPMIGDPPPPPMPPVRVPVTGDPPPPPLIGSKPDKKDNYDEDWHTRVEDSYVQISQEYYKSADYAKALEAYNKDRRKPGERIIRVPPPWVLEEQFPSLVGAKSDKADKPEAKSGGTPNFEPAAPRSERERSAPPPAATGNNEYRVKSEAGETIREIARKVYGDANAWQKLWKLNPDLDPTLPIPNGTTLRLDR